MHSYLLIYRYLFGHGIGFVRGKTGKIDFSCSGIYENNISKLTKFPGADIIITQYNTI